MLFFSLAKAYTKQQFETIMGRIDQIDTRIRQYLFDTPEHEPGSCKLLLSKDRIETQALIELKIFLTQGRKNLVLLVQL